MIIKLPMGVTMDTSNIPNNLERKIFTDEVYFI